MIDHAMVKGYSLTALRQVLFPLALKRRYSYT